MHWEFLNYWVSILLSGMMVGVNPCALVVLWFFFVYLSKNARTPQMILCGGWIFLVVAFVVNMALIFGVLDLILKQPWSPVLFLGSYGLIALVLVVQAVLHFRDWRQYKFYNIPVDQFKIKLPSFLNFIQNPSAADWKNFILKGVLVSLFLNLLGVAWGHDYALYVSFTQIYFSKGLFLALMQLVVFFVGYLLPLVLVWMAMVQWAKFKGHESLLQYQVAFSKVFQTAVSLALAIVLLVMLSREFFNI